MSTAPARFITILLSHYCGKARWGLDRCSVPYREEPHVPLWSRLATRRGEGGTVPVFVSEDIRLRDSTVILVHADQFAGGDVLYPRELETRRTVEALVKSFDEDLGPHTRRWAYSHLLPDKELLRDLWSRGAPKHEAFFLPLILPIGRRLLRSSYRITPASAARSLESIGKVFQQVGDRLGDGREYLVDNRFSAADLTFAALAAPVLFPAGNRAVLPDLARLPVPMREEVLRLRETAAGRFAQGLYLKER